MNGKEQRRVQVLNELNRGRLTGKEGAERLELSLRQVRRLLAAYGKEGVAALAHGNRGRRPVHATLRESKERVVALATGPYAGFNQHHFTELLGEREGLVLSRSTVRRILLAAGIRSPRRRRPAQHRRRRERYPQEGMLLQIDGSPHPWLEDRGPRLTLVGAIDDATGAVPYALFREQEDTWGHLLLLRGIIQGQGVPQALYSDRHGIFQVNPRREPSVEEQLEGKPQLTQFGRALRELGINRISALSPQAKGRIERLWGTFQDRLVSELRLAQVATLEGANAFLAQFLSRYNARFAVRAAREGSAYGELEANLSLDAVLCCKHSRTVARDNTVRLGPRSLQILPGPQRLSYARARVEVQERWDGRLVVTYQGQSLATRDAPPLPATLRTSSPAPVPVPPHYRALQGSPPGARGREEVPWGPERAGACRQAGPQRPVVKPGPNHPWRKTMVTKSLNR